MPDSEFIPNFAEATTGFIDHARAKLEYKTFAAFSNENKLVATVSCQVWDGTMPCACVSKEFKVGTMWAVYVQPESRRKGIATKLVQACIEHWKAIGCTAAVLIYASDAGRRIYERLGFAKDNMLFLDLPAFPGSKTTAKTETVGWSVSPADSKSDPVLVQNWRKVWLESGTAAVNLKKDVATTTTEFISRARDTLEFQSFVARDSLGNVVGSAACQTWEGPLPLVIQERTFKLGSVWGIYVDPAHRRKGIGERLLQCCAEHLASIGCKRAITLANSGKAASWLKRRGFDPSNAMTLALQPSVPAAAQAGETLQLPTNVTDEALVDLRRTVPGLAGAEDQKLAWLLRANANQLRALSLAAEEESGVVAVQKRQGLWMDPEDNWFTRNVSRFGKGFDMEQLGKDRAKLTSKFDRLSPNYEAWTLGNRSVVEDWVAKMMHDAEQHGVLTARSHVLDVACGAGLMGHTLRMVGYGGMLSGVDISPGMVDQAHGRRCYDVLWAQDVREGVEAETGSADVVLCTGAMELLNVTTALTEFRRLLSSTGELWITFQLRDAAQKDSTAHQHVQGMEMSDIERELCEHGFNVRSVETCASAFFTPSPAQDGSLLPVPYAFLRCVRTC